MKHTVHYVLFGVSLVQFRRQRAQGIESAFANHSVSFLRYYAQVTVGFAVISEQRTVRKRVIRLFAVAAALQKQHERFIPCRFAALQDFVDSWAYLVPDFLPNVLRALAQRPRMLLAQRHAGIRIVVQKSEFWPPTHPHRKPGR